jgi:hypothetical protein
MPAFRKTLRDYNDTKAIALATGTGGTPVKIPVAVHNEDASSVPIIDPAMERRVVWKLDTRVLPLVFVLCMLFHGRRGVMNLLTSSTDMLASLDRSNIGTVHSYHNLQHRE